MPEIEVVVTHSERVTLRVGDVFLKIDTDQARIDREVEVMARAPIPTPEVFWRTPPVLALGVVPGAALGVLSEPARASSAAWVAVGAAVRTLHDAPLPPWPSSQCQQQPALSSRGTVEFPPGLDSECEWLVANDVVTADVVRRNRQVAEAALRPWTPVFIHGAAVCGEAVNGLVHRLDEPVRLVVVFRREDEFGVGIWERQTGLADRVVPPSKPMSKSIAVERQAVVDRRHRNEARQAMEGEGQMTATATSSA